MEDNLFDELTVSYRTHKNQDKLYPQIAPRLWDSLCSSLEDGISELNQRLNSVDDFTYRKVSDKEFTVTCKTGQRLVGRRDDLERATEFEITKPSYQGGNQTLAVRLTVTHNNVVFEGDATPEDVVARLLQALIQ
jgi:hypothetical protein